MYDTPNRELVANQGRWMSPDPAGAGWNLYAYVTNPNSDDDPTGLDGQAGCQPGTNCQAGGIGSCSSTNTCFQPSPCSISEPCGPGSTGFGGETPFGTYTGTTSGGNGDSSTYSLTLVAGMNGPYWINNFNNLEASAGGVASEFGLLLPPDSPFALTSLTPTITFPSGPTVSRVTVPTLFERFNSFGHGWELNHPKALGVAACLTMPPGAAQDLADLKKMANGQPLPPSGNTDSTQGGSGGGAIWINNINSQRNGGQSPYGSATGAATANAVGAANRVCWFCAALHPESIE